MTKINKTKEEKVVCSVCLQKPAKASLDCCSHQFCFKCIKRWSKTKNTCPLCRQSFLQIRTKKKTIEVQPTPIIQRFQHPITNGLQQQRRIIYVPVFFNPPNPMCFFFNQNPSLLYNSPILNNQLNNLPLMF